MRFGLIAVFDSDSPVEQQLREQLAPAGSIRIDAPRMPHAALKSRRVGASDWREFAHEVFDRQVWVARCDGDQVSLNRQLGVGRDGGEQTAADGDLATA